MIFLKRRKAKIRRILSEEPEAREHKKKLPLTTSTFSHAILCSSALAPAEQGNILRKRVTERLAHISAKMTANTMEISAIGLTSHRLCQGTQLEAYQVCIKH